jgi:uncharacterized membrane protein YbaN (DUF454 family)
MLLIGILGFVLPVLNGTLFVVIGLILISFEHKKTEDFLNRLASRNSKVQALYTKLYNSMKRLFRV